VAPILIVLLLILLIFLRINNRTILLVVTNALWPPQPKLPPPPCCALMTVYYLNLAVISDILRRECGDGVVRGHLPHYFTNIHQREASQFHLHACLLAIYVYAYKFVLCLSVYNSLVCDFIGPQWLRTLFLCLFLGLLSNFQSTKTFSFCNRS